ncbi:UDP-N-acetylmuramoyl-L-alanyl-D-glutamate--2,6-diaminopimelate ligase [Psychrobacillus vulpis]|uniref:UDP-N-acetylmuramoyl-L-alanyl-D-glutamate--2, 6-diaminopimelate ligase n=1 Tax=Psychrobacillus vulpis TaxID=2325572 RepID=UPI00140A89C2|nr:UDP-N-acetylmuramoyl-L-alanyl-D-glutamate--2,6-diaminopimelate ligase [Psychrobacillus vulpis]
MQYQIIGNLACVKINRCIDHSKQIKEGDVFVSQTNDRTYIEEAIQRGAIAVLTEVYIHDCSVPQIIIPIEMNCFIQRISTISYELYGKKMKTIGITGTNGKTTVASFIGQLLMQQSKSVCVIGTLGVFVNGQKIELCLRSNTTLPFYDFIQVVKYCYEQNVEFIILEASSQGLLDQRLSNYPIDVGVFLNIGKDHIEFHGGMVPYKKSKELLVLQSKKLVVNDDDSWCKSVGNRAHIPVTRFGENKKNEVVYQNIDYTNENVKYRFRISNEELQVEMTNSGYYNGMNLAAAIAVLVALRIPLREIRTVKLPKGRLERINNKEGIEVLVDYAHTPDALEASLSAISAYAKQNVFVVFGCGGNRDKQKRKWMGEVATKFSTKAIITNDNPRNEHPDDIINDIMCGADKGKVIIQKDRKQAIILALSIAKKGDIVLIAGKGHEQEQIIEDSVVPFSDHEVIRNYFEELDGLMTKKDPVA